LLVAFGLEVFAAVWQFPWFFFCSFFVCLFGLWWLSCASLPFNKNLLI
jgi:hypothetical protein